MQRTMTVWTVSALGLVLVTGCGGKQMSPEQAVGLVGGGGQCPIKAKYCYTMTDADTAASRLGLKWQVTKEGERYAEKNGLYYQGSAAGFHVFDDDIDETQRAAIIVANVLAGLSGQASGQQFNTVDEFVNAYIKP